MDGSRANQGLMLRSNESSGVDSARLGFLTKEGPDPSLKPYLQIVRTGQAAPDFIQAELGGDWAPALCEPSVGVSLGRPAGPGEGAEAGYVEQSRCGSD